MGTPPSENPALASERAAWKPRSDSIVLASKGFGATVSYLLSYDCWFDPGVML